MLHVLALAAAVAAAEPKAAPRPDEPAPPAILRIDGPDVYVDLGRSGGARPGARVRVNRVVRVLKPGASQPLVDRFLLGELELAEVGEVLSRARPDPQLARLLRLGDTVELAATPPALAAASPAGAVVASIASSCPPGDPEGPAFREAWVTAQPLPPERRAAHWEAYLASHRASAVAEPLRREIALLRSAAAPAPDDRPYPLGDAEVSAPSRAFEGDPLEVVLTFPPRGQALQPRAAVLNWRGQGESLYRPVRMSFEGDAYRVRVPADAVRAPGLEYWFSVVDGAGTERRLEGMGEVRVRPLPGGPVPSRADRSEVEVRSDFVDWNKLKGNDYYWSFESDYLYRVRSRGLHAIRLGFGTYQGMGESLRQAIEDEAAGRPYRTRTVGYDYVFTDLDLHAGELVGLVGRALAGVNRNGFGAGIEGRLRIGRDPGTHLVVSTGFTAGIGNRNEITLAWDQVEGWPMAASVVVTNEPVLEDYGVRFAYQVGRSLWRWVDLSMRLGYELRDIRHAGVGLGLAANFHW
jgi:hypothetical protein